MLTSKMLLATAFGLVLQTACTAQDADSSSARPPEPHFICLKYPADRDLTLAVVAGKPISLGDLVNHITKRHHPGFAEGLESQPGIHRMLQSDLIAPWVRHFADIKALEFATKDANLDKVKLEAAIGARLKAEFEAWLAKYVANREANGHPTELTQQRINRLLADYQLRYGLAAEMQGWLDYLEPGGYTRPELHTFFTGNARFFGGRVTFAHILVQHRDAGTGILLKPAGLGIASERLAIIKGSLREDGSNFEEVARLRSEDTRTAPKGGVLNGVHRFDDRLPAILCRMAWQLKDGEISKVVESQYGWHLIKRLEFGQNIFMLFTDDAMPAIKIIMRRAMQEQHLFGARESAKVELKF